MSERADPWATIEEHYAPGQVVTGSISRIAPVGVFASIDVGIEGLIPLAHLPLRILEIDAQRHHLKLSLRQAENASF